MVLKDDELNVLRYVCGFVIRKVLERYEKKSADNVVYSQYVECLGELAVEEEGDDSDRGGLYP